MIRKRNQTLYTDKILALCAIMIAFLGIFFVYSATYIPGEDSVFNVAVTKQIIWVALGLAVMLFIANADYLNMLNYAYLAYGINLLFLVFLLTFGGERYGAKRWIDLGPVSMQPSEFIKITVIMAVSVFLGQRRERIGTLANYSAVFLLVMPAIILIFLQPDLGTAFMLIPVIFATLFICGERIVFIIGSVFAGLAATPFLWHFLKDYQKTRLLVFLKPDLDPLGAGYTIIQSKIAIGSGGIFGKGWLGGTQSYLKFLPERHTDFIFSVIGEEWGFLGAAVLIGLYGLVIWRGIKIISAADTIYAKGMASGVVTLVAFQVFINISMAIGLMPVVGLPLPGISYGGSSIVVMLAGIGFLLSISRRLHR